MQRPIRRPGTFPDAGFLAINCSFAPTGPNKGDLDMGIDSAKVADAKNWEALGNKDFNAGHVEKAADEFARAANLRKQAGDIDGAVNDFEKAGDKLANSGSREEVLRVISRARRMTTRARRFIMRKPPSLGRTKRQAAQRTIPRKVISTMRRVDCTIRRGTNA